MTDSFRLAVKCFLGVARRRCTCDNLQTTRSIPLDSEICSLLPSLCLPFELYSMQLDGVPMPSCLYDAWQLSTCDVDSLLLVYRNMEYLFSGSSPPLFPHSNYPPTRLATGAMSLMLRSTQKLTKSHVEKYRCRLFASPPSPLLSSPLPHSLTLSAQAGSGRTEMAF